MAFALGISASAILVAGTASAWRQDFPGSDDLSCYVHGGCDGGLASAVLDLASLPDGDIVVVGELHDPVYAPGLPSSTDPTAWIARLDLASGAVEWSRQYSIHGDTAMPEAFTKIAVRPDGDLLVGGHAADSGGVVHALVAKISAATGDIAWTTMQGGPGASISALASDSAGNPVAAVRDGAFKVIKLDASAPSLAWSYAAPTAAGLARDLALDADGNVLVIGSFGDNTGSTPDSGFGAVKLSPSGVELWRREIVTGPDAPSSKANAVALLSSGDAIVVGRSASQVIPGSIEFLAARIANADGVIGWQSIVPDGATSSPVHSEPADVAIGDDDAIYVGGRLSNEFGIARIDSSDGSVDWSGTYAGAFSYATTLVPTASGAVVATGYEPFVFTTVGVAAADGSQMWKIRLRGLTRGNSSGGTGRAIAAAADGTVVIGGFTADGDCWYPYCYSSASATVLQLAADTGAGCGNGTIDAGETCDDSNGNDGDCCSSTCTLEPEGSSCGDGRVCNGDETCGPNGTCNAEVRLNCDDDNACTQDACSEPDGCAHQNRPAHTCSVLPSASVRILDSEDDERDEIQWKWTRGPLLPHDALGDPSSDTTYTLCIYDSTAGTHSPAVPVRIPPSTNWTDKDPRGWNLKDSAGAEDGVQRVRLKTGPAGKSKGQIGARGPNVPMPVPISVTEFFDQDPRVTIQLHKSDTSPACWTSQFSAGSSTKNTAAQYKAKN